MAIFLVGAALLFLASPEASPWSLVPRFLVQMAAGGAIGLGAGWLLLEILKRSSFRHGGLAFVISIAGVLIAYGLAEVVGGNGFLAAYVAGLVAGNRVYTAKRIVTTFQDGLAWLAQVVMFLTLGLLAAPTNLVDVIAPGLAITFILMLVARPLSVFVCLAPFKRFGWRAKLFVSWAGCAEPCRSCWRPSRSWPACPEPSPSSTSCSSWFCIPASSRVRQSTGWPNTSAWRREQIVREKRRPR